MELELSERVAGLDPATFWQECPTPDQWRSMVAKYEALGSIAELARGERGPHYRERMSELAARWPGALRESELIGPERVAARLDAARLALADEPARARAAWTTSPALAALGWAEIHALILDILGFRRSTTARETANFVAWLGAPAQAEARARWAPREQLGEVLGPAVRVRSAYLCLAARAGLTLPALHHLLFARAGHWDRRAEDPSWAEA